VREGVTREVRISTRIMKVAMVMGLIAIALVGLGIPSAAALDGPTPPELADPVAAGTYPEIQVIYFEGAAAGSYQLRVTVPPAAAVAVPAIQFNDTAATVQGLLDTAIGAGNVTVVGTGVPAVAPFTLTFGGTAGGKDIVTQVFNFSTMATGDVPPALVTPIVTSVQQGATITTADVAPHGGYSSLTDYCLQCHQVHNGRSNNTNGEYALLAEVNVTSTCATCHGYLGNSPTGAEDPGFPGQEGTASLRAVYTADPIHNIGYSSSRFDDGWSYGWTFGGGPTGASTRRAGAGVSSTYGGGFYCGTCHTPHGEFGQLVNSKWTYSSASTDPDGAGPLTGAPVMANWANNTKIFWDNPTDSPDAGYAVMFLWQPAAGDPWQVCTAAAGVGPCYYAQTEDAEGQLVSLYGYKLLTYVPNHQYPTMGTGVNAGLYLQPNGTYAALPPGGMFADANYVFGSLARDGLYPRDELATRVLVGHLHGDIASGALSIPVTEYSAGDASAPTPPAIMTADIENQALPFKIRIDDEIMMVTARSAPVSTDPDGFRTYDLTVTRSTEDPKEPWATGYSPSVPAPPATAHNINADVTLVPTLLINDGPSPLGLKSGMRLPLHVKFSAGSGSNLEIAVLMKRTPSGVANQGLYTVGRGVDGSPQTESHVSGTNVLAQSGSNVATVKSWGTDIYDHDSALWCGTCHTYSVDAAFGGQWHSHPTGCTACHGNPADGSSADFPHSSTNEFMLQEVPDALCLECHHPGALP
jgi:hypothetical protein